MRGKLKFYLPMLILLSLPLCYLPVLPGMPPAVSYFHLPRLLFVPIPAFTLLLFCLDSSKAGVRLAKPLNYGLILFSLSLCAYAIYRQFLVFPVPISLLAERYILLAGLIYLFWRGRSLRYVKEREDMREKRLAYRFEHYPYILSDKEVWLAVRKRYSHCCFGLAMALLVIFLFVRRWFYPTIISVHNSRTSRCRAGAPVPGRRR